MRRSTATSHIAAKETRCFDTILLCKITQQPCLVSTKNIIGFDLKIGITLHRKTTKRVSKLLCLRNGKCYPTEEEITKEFKEDNNPVVCIDFKQAQNYCKINNKRLPTADEWFYSQKAEESYLYSGSNNPDEIAWYFDNSDNKTHSVGTKKANGFGDFGEKL